MSNHCSFHKDAPAVSDITFRAGEVAPFTVVPCPMTFYLCQKCKDGLDCEMKEAVKNAAMKWWGFSIQGKEEKEGE